MQIIFHIDLNAFFASAEISVHPELKNKPLVISRESRRSIVTTASYESRQYGIHSAMPLFQAKELCPEIIIVEPHFDLYRTLSHSFFEIISEFSQKLEVASIDECYVDMTHYILENQLQPMEVAIMIQNKVYNDLSLQCSIGIAPNKFLAKMASDMKKPMGITMITNHDVKEKIWPLPISDMFGIGKKTQPKLIELGIHTIGDLAKYENYSKIKPIFGKNALIYYQRANGKDFSKINNQKNELKSVGHSQTFERDSNDENYIQNVLKKLSIEVSNRAKQKQLVSNSIAITLKYTRFKSKTRQTIIDVYTNDAEVIYATALRLFDNIYNKEMLRLVGVSLTNVVNVKNLNQQISLFEHQDIDVHEKDETEKLLNTLNASFQDQRFVKASSLLKDGKSIQKKY